MPFLRKFRCIFPPATADNNDKSVKRSVIYEQPAQNPPPVSYGGSHIFCHRDTFPWVHALDNGSCGRVMPYPHIPYGLRYEKFLPGAQMSFRLADYHRRGAFRRAYRQHRTRLEHLGLLAPAPQSYGADMLSLFGDMDAHYRACALYLPFLPWGDFSTAGTCMIFSFGTFIFSFLIV